MLIYDSSLGMIFLEHRSLPQLSYQDIKHKLNRPKNSLDQSHKNKRTSCKNTLGAAHTSKVDGLFTQGAGTFDMCCAWPVSENYLWDLRFSNPQLLGTI